MTVDYAESLLNGKYANMRKNALKKNAPNYYAEMVKNGTLEQHLIEIQESCENYIDSAVEHFKKSEEYNKAAQKSDVDAMKLLNYIRLENEAYIVREWVL